VAIPHLVFRPPIDARVYGPGDDSLMPDNIGNVRVRTGRPSDAGPLSEVAQEAKALWQYHPAWLESWRPQLTLTEQDLERMIVRVAESNDGIIGFGAVDRVSGGWEIAHLWVKPAFTRRGIGRTILGHLADAAREAGAHRLRIESDPQAVAFYLSAGAVRTGSIPAPMPGAPERELPVLELVLES